MTTSNTVKFRAYGIPKSMVGVPVSNLYAKSVLVSFSPDDTWDTALEKAKVAFDNDGFVPTKDIMADSLHQPDVIEIAGGAVLSRAFDRLCAQSVDWSKLPDWPAYSQLMAHEPL